MRSTMMEFPIVRLATLASTAVVLATFAGAAVGEANAPTLAAAKNPSSQVSEKQVSGKASPKTASTPANTKPAAGPVKAAQPSGPNRGDSDGRGVDRIDGDGRIINGEIPGGVVRDYNRPRRPINNVRRSQQTLIECTTTSVIVDRQNRRQAIEGRFPLPTGGRGELPAGFVDRTNTWRPIGPLPFGVGTPGALSRDPVFPIDAADNDGDGRLDRMNNVLGDTNPTVVYYAFLEAQDLVIDWAEGADNANLIFARDPNAQDLSMPPDGILDDDPTTNVNELFLETDGIPEVWPGVGPGFNPRRLDVILPPVDRDPPPSVEAALRAIGLDDLEPGGPGVPNPARPAFAEGSIGEQVFYSAQANRGQYGVNATMDTYPAGSVISEAQREAIITAMRTIERVANIRFVPKPRVGGTTYPLYPTGDPWNPATRTSTGILFPFGADPVGGAGQSLDDPYDDAPFILFVNNLPGATANFSETLGQERFPVEADWRFDDLNGDGFPDMIDTTGDGFPDQIVFSRVLPQLLTPPSEDLNGDGMLTMINEDLDGDGMLDPSEDRNGNGILDPGEDLNGNGMLDPSEDLNGNGILDTMFNEDVNGNMMIDTVQDFTPPIAGPTVLPQSEDLDGDGVIDVNEDTNFNGRLDRNEDVNNDGTFDIGEDVNFNGILDPSEDLNNNGILDPGEDLNGNGMLDPSEDVNRNGVLDIGEDLDGDGNLDVQEDFNLNGVFDIGETDLNGDGNFDIVAEDRDGDGRFDTGEDVNFNGMLDPGEDRDADGVLDLTEDLDGDGNFDIGEDRDQDGVLDLTEDLNGNGIFDLPFEDLDGDGNFDNVNEDANMNGDFDDGEDLDGDGYFDIGEDRNGNGLIDNDEDINNNGVLDGGEIDLNGDGNFDTLYEDVNGNLVFDPGEDVDGDGFFDLGEDLNANGLLDVGEDRNGNGVLDRDDDLNNNGFFDVTEDIDGDGRLDAVHEDLDGDDNFDNVNEDVDGDGNFDNGEDLNANGVRDGNEPDPNQNGILDLDEDINNNGVQDPIERDIDGDGRVDQFNEDIDGDGILDMGEDLDFDGILDPAEDLDNDGNFDTGEDRNQNRQLDPGEDIDLDGILDLTEDLNNNGMLDPGEDLDLDGRFDNVNEDANMNGVMDPAEDVDGDGILDLSEDLDGDGVFTIGEDIDGDGRLDLFNEDVNGNGVLDVPPGNYPPAPSPFTTVMGPNGPQNSLLIVPTLTGRLPLNFFADYSPDALMDVPVFDTNGDGIPDTGDGIIDGWDRDLNGVLDDFDAIDANGDGVGDDFIQNVVDVDGDGQLGDEGRDGFYDGDGIPDATPMAFGNTGFLEPVQAALINLQVQDNSEGSVGVIMHEIMHALGFIHEHQRPDRDQFIELEIGNIAAEGVNDYRIADAVFDDYNIGNFYVRPQYDFASIMHYGPGTFAEIATQINGIPTRPTFRVNDLFIDGSGDVLQPDGSPAFPDQDFVFGLGPGLTTVLSPGDIETLQFLFGVNTDPDEEAGEVDPEPGFTPWQFGEDPACPVDVNRDNSVTPADVSLFRALWQNRAANADVDFDGDVDQADLVTFLTTLQMIGFGFCGDGGGPGAPPRNPG